MKIGASAWQVMLVLFLHCVSTASASGMVLATNDCARETLNRIPSPDGGIVAELVQYHCDPLVGGASILVNVVLSRADGFADEIVLSVDTAGDINQTPKVEWRSPNEISLQVRNLALIGIRKNEAKGAAVKLLFDPDDKASRAENLKRRGQWAQRSKYDLDR